MNLQNYIMRREKFQNVWMSVTTLFCGLAKESMF